MTHQQARYSRDRQAPGNLAWPPSAPIGPYPFPTRPAHGRHRSAGWPEAVTWAPSGSRYPQVMNTASSRGSARAGLLRFVEAQAPAYSHAVAELAAGRKESHWIWFVFPQLAVLGRSDRARFYGLADRNEALDYWQHPLLRQRLLHCVDLMLAIPDRSAHQILGSPDDLKLRSCLTLFEVVAPDEPRFGLALERFYDGERDPRTREALSGDDGG